MKSSQIDFGDEKVSRSILAAALPMLLAQLLNLLYNIVDRIYIGRIPGTGPAALAGVGLCFPVITIITAFSNLFGVGGAPLCAIERGKKNRAGAGHILNNAFFMLMLTSLLLLAGGIIFHKPVLYLFGASDRLYPYAAVYMIIYLLGTPAVMTSLGLNPYINCQGFAAVGMRTVLLGAVLNIILDPILIFAFHMGVAGAAVATVISQVASAIWVLTFLTGKRAEIRLSLSELKPDPVCIGRITLLGTASFVMQVTDSITQIACNSMLQQFGGDLYIGIMTVINSIRQIVQVPVMALSDGATPVISYNYGAGDRKKIISCVKILTGIEVVYTMAAWLLIRLMPGMFIRIFSNDPQMIAAGVPAVNIFFAGFVMMAFQYCGQTIFKAMGKSGRAIFFSVLRKGIIVLPLTLILPGLMGLGTKGVFLAEPISNVIGGAACYLTMYFTLLRPMIKEAAKEGVNPNGNE